MVFGSGEKSLCKGLVAKERIWKKNNGKKVWSWSKSKFKINNKCSITIRKSTMWEIVRNIKENEERKLVILVMQ